MAFIDGVNRIPFNILRKSGDSIAHFTGTLKELGHHINPKCTIYITIQVTAPTILHCKLAVSKEIASLYCKNKLAVLLIASWSLIW